MYRNPNQPGGFDLGMKVCQVGSCQRKAADKVKGLWRCPEHLQEHRHKIAEAASRPRCRCGNMTRQDSDVCGACEEKRDRADYARRAQIRELDNILAMETIDDVKTYLINKLMENEF